MPNRGQAVSTPLLPSAPAPSLRELAERAQAFHVSLPHGPWHSLETFECDGYFAADAAFLAACSPENILALLAELDELRSALREEPFSEWHEDEGAVLWWRVPVCEPPYCGCPDDSDWPFVEDDEEEALVWTPINAIANAVVASRAARAAASEKP